MKTLLKLILGLTLISVSTQINAQYLALKGGLNLSNQIVQNNDSTFSSDYTNRAGFHAGAVVGIGFGMFAVEGGLLVSTKGYNYDYDVSGGSVSSYSNPIYLDVPINLKLRMGVGIAKIYGSAGPIISYGIGGSNNYESNLPGTDPVIDEEKIKWGTGEENDLKPLDVGLGLGAGIELGKISLGFTYNWGFTNLAPVSNNGLEIKNRNMQFSLGIKLFG